MTVVSSSGLEVTAVWFSGLEVTAVLPTLSFLPKRFLETDYEVEGGNNHNINNRKDTGRRKLVLLLLASKCDLDPFALDLNVLLCCLITFVRMKSAWKLLMSDTCLTYISIQFHKGIII